MVLVPWLNKSLWLFHVYILLGQAIQVSTNKVDSPECRVMFSCYDCCHLYIFESSDSCPCFVRVDSELLSVSLPNQPSFILDPISFPIPFNIICISTSIP